MSDFSTTVADALQKEVRVALGPAGLMPFGWVALNADDFEEDGEAGRGLLIGNIGSSLWPSFSTSPEALDGGADPLDRWTVGQLAPVADRLGAAMRYPFGRPLWPFQDYAKRATGMDHSPLGLLIHPQYGLWTALRGLMVFQGAFKVPVHHVPWHPCDHCVEKPCLHTCPVGAFSSEGYDYPTCRTHVAGHGGTACLNGGCLARQACPVGEGFTYDEDHQAFHMGAFV